MSANSVGLPPRVFMYTLDQLSVLTQISEQQLHVLHIFHEGRDVGVRKPHQMVARNIAPPDERPDWRVVEKEFVRWMKVKGFKYYDRGYVTV